MKLRAAVPVIAFGAILTALAVGLLVLAAQGVFMSRGADDVCLNVLECPRPTPQPIGQSPTPRTG